MFFVDSSHRESHELGISNEVVFLPSISSEKKADLLSRCLCVLYTPEDEHFGIVPLEAMAAGKPVLACNSGGPVESIVDGVTGFLCAPVAEVIDLLSFLLQRLLHRISSTNKSILPTAGVCISHAKGEQKSRSSDAHGLACAAARE